MGHLDDIRDYWTARAAGYSESVTESIDSGRSDHWLGIIREHLGADGPLRVLDVGTGPGFFPVILGREGHRVTAVDCCDGMLEQACANCARYGVPADLARMDAGRLDFPDGTFDVVISRNVVWNLEEPLEAYREWLRVLRDGGKLMVFDGNHYLYLYDREFREAGGDRESAEHPSVGGVDVTRMRDIAMDLPLSRARRPQWDLDSLIELGVQRIEIETDGRDSCRVEKDGRTVCLPFSFFICATKRSLPGRHREVVVGQPVGEVADPVEDPPLDPVDHADVPEPLPFQEDYVVGGAVRVPGPKLGAGEAVVVHVPAARAVHPPEQVRHPRPHGRGERVVEPVPVRVGEDAAVPQDPVPLRHDRPGVPHGPEHVVADHRVERRVREVQRAGVASAEVYVQAVVAGVPPGALQHLPGDVHGRQAVPHVGKLHGGDPGPASDVQDLQGAVPEDGPEVLLPGPAFPQVRVSLDHEPVVRCGAAVPVGLDAVHGDGM